MNATTDMAKAADATVRLDAWRSVFEKTNRIVSQRPVTVKIVGDADMPGGMEDIPGWSDGEVIHFNGPLVLDMLKAQDSMAAVLRLKGLNYHELSHVLYTPRASDELPKRVVERAKADRDKRWWYSFNALEDQRIETWFTATYGPSRRYFEAAVLQWLVSKGNAEAAILIHGRKYLPARIRVQAGRVFVKKYGQPLYDEFKAVIDQYLTVVLPADSVRALTLVSKYRELLKLMQDAAGAPLPPLPVEDNGCGHNAGHVPDRDDPTVVRSGKVMQREAKAARDRAKKEAEKADEADAKAAADIEAEGKPDPSEGDPQTGNGVDEAPAQGQGEAEGNSPSGEGEGVGEGEDAGADGDGAKDGIPGQGAGSQGAGEHHVIDKAELDAAIKDLMDEADQGIDQIYEDAEIQAEVDAVLDAVKAIAQNGNINAHGLAAKGRGTTPASAEQQIAVRRVVNILTKIRQDAEPEIMRARSAGRVDVRRLISRRPNDFDIFTAYDEGAEEETGIESVVLLDVSGSMSYCLQEASAAVWVLKRAFDKLDIRTTCLVYDTDHYVLFQPSEKAKVQVPVINTMGGTDPSSALQQALTILGKSHMPNKVLVTVTDGQWQGRDEDYKDVMKSLKRLGVTSMLLGLGNAQKHYGKHYHDIGHDIDRAQDLPKAVLALVGQIMRSATNQD